MSVVGFDFGYQSSYIAVVRQGGVETATNDYSQRATPSCVSFGSKSRCMGVAARQQIATNLKNTIMSFKHLIGRKFSDPVVQSEQKFLPFHLVPLPNDGIGIKVSYLNDTRVFTPEQILAILLTKLKHLSESYLKTKVSDCVISVPCFWTDTQRRALLDAAKISDLNCLKILNDTTATALAYGIYKQDLPEANDKPRRIVFVDMGHASTQASLCAFNKGKLIMVGTVWDLSLGGRDFDAVLYDYFNSEFIKKYNVDANTNERAKFRLFDECERVKKQMSANSNPLPLGIECFLNDKDVSSVIKRADFEELSKNLWNKFTILLNRLLTETKMKPGDVDVVELVGGGTRLPMLKQIINQIFEKDPNTTLNQDEAVSRGCALQCAILSPAVRVREFSMTDVQPFAIKLTWKALSGMDEGEMLVFEEHHPFPYSKMLTFYRKEPFVLDAAYAYPNHIPYLKTEIGRFCINNVVPAPNGENSKVKVKVRINVNGIFSVTSASLYESQQQTEDEQEEAAPSVDAEKVDMDTCQQNGSKDEPMQTDVQTSDNADELKPTELTKAAKPKIKTKSVILPITETVAQMTNDDILKFRSMELELQQHDRTENEKADAKNALEEYVYDIRGQLSDKLVDYILSKDKDQFLAQLELIENWLYDEGDDQPKEVYAEKLANLKKFGEPVQERYFEAQERPAAFDEFGRSLQMARKFYEACAAKDPAFDHIVVADLEKVRKAIEEKQGWFDKQINSQSKRLLTEPPVVFVSQIRSEREAFERVVLPVINKPKPKVEPPVEPVPKASSQTPEADCGKADGDLKDPKEVNMDVE